MVEVKDVPQQSRFEVYVDGARAGLLDYELDGDTVTARHTEIDAAYGGRGLGSELVKVALDQIRETGSFVRPLCPFVRDYIDDNPEYADLVQD